MTYIHTDADDHQLRIEADQWRIFCQTVLLHKPDLNRPQEIPVQSSIHNQNQHFRDFVPDVVDLDKCFVWWRYDMGGDPDNEDSNIDSGDNSHSAPFDVANCFVMLGDKCDTVDDDLHKQLDLEDPEEKGKEQDFDSENFSQQVDFLMYMARKTYVGPTIPCRNSHPSMPMRTLATISPQTM